MSANGNLGSLEHFRRARCRGLTLVEVSVSILLVTTVILAAIGARYLSVKQARRADAYNGAGRLALLLLEGWRSNAEPDDYDPVANFGPTSAVHMTISTSGTGPTTPTGFTTLGRYRVVFDNVNYYATLAYINPTPMQPARLHAAVGFRHQYETGDVSTGANVVRLTTYD